MRKLPLPLPLPLKSRAAAAVRASAASRCRNPGWSRFRKKQGKSIFSSK